MHTVVRPAEVRFRRQLDVVNWIIHHLRHDIRVVEVIWIDTYS